MKKQILEELNDIKYLFNYNRGKVISEQEQFEVEEIDFEEIDLDDEDDDEDINYLKGEFNEEYDDQEEFDTSMDDMELDEEMDLPVMLPGTKEKERIKVDPGTKPKKPKTPYSPKPGPKPDPKARKRKGDMPTWLTFDELGIDFE
jgi:hypothetical protein